MALPRNPTKRAVLVYPRPGGINNTGYNGTHAGYRKLTKRMGMNIDLANKTRAWNSHGSIFKIYNFPRRWRVPGRYLDGRHHPLAPHSRRRFRLLSHAQWILVLTFYNLDCRNMDVGQMRAAWGAWCGIRIPIGFLVPV